MLFAEGDFSDAGNEHFFAAGWGSPPLDLQGFYQMVGLGEGVGQSIDGEGNKQDYSRGDIFGKMGNTEGIIQGNNSAGHCFVLRDLIPRNSLK